MKKIFRYTRFANADMNAVVEAGQTLARSYKEKNKQKEYIELNKDFNEKFMKICVEGSQMVFTSIEDVKNPMIYSNIQFKNIFGMVLSQIITPIVPENVVDGYDALYDVQQVGWGDAAKYQVNSNALYIVNDLAEGVAHGAQQTAYNTEYSVKASRRSISVTVDWYQVAAGVIDWGFIVSKISESFINYINALVIKSMSGIVSSAATYGLAGYLATGFSDTNWLTLRKKVSLANGGSDVYALGTNIALGKVLPQQAGFRFAPTDSVVTTGYLPSYKQVPLIEIGNALIPNTINDTPLAMLSDDFIYFIPVGFNKPCKVAIEGETVTVSEDPLTKPDHSYGMTIDMRIGADIIAGSKFGIMESIV